MNAVKQSSQQSWKMLFINLGMTIGVPTVSLVVMNVFVHQKIPILEWLAFGPLNIAFFALPQLVWFFVTRWLKMSRFVVYGGLCGANVALIAVLIWILHVSTDGDSLGWIFYWPVAAVTTLTGASSGTFCSRPRKPKPE
jgi:hypothetical protein